MGTRTNLDRLKQNPPDSARLITETGSVINSANRMMNEEHADPIQLSLLGSIYFTSDTVQVSAGQSHTFTIETGANYVVQFARDLKVTSGLWDIDVLLGGTVSGGTATDMQNVRLDLPIENTSTLLSGTTVTGFTLGATDFIAAPSQNKAGGLSARAGGTIVVYPPNSSFSVRATNTSNSAERIHLDYVFSELTAEEIGNLRGLNVEES